GLEESQGELGPEDGRVEVLEQVGDATDVVLVGVGEHEAHHLLAALAHVREVRKDQVDPEHLLRGEHEARVDDQDLAVVLEEGHVPADLAHAAQPDDPGAARGGLAVTGGAPAGPPAGGPAPAAPFAPVASGGRAGCACGLGRHQLTPTLPTSASRGSPPPHRAWLWATGDGGVRPDALPVPWRLSPGSGWR